MKKKNLQEQSHEEKLRQTRVNVPESWKPRRLEVYKDTLVACNGQEFTLTPGVWDISFNKKVRVVRIS